MYFNLKHNVVKNEPIIIVDNVYNDTTRKYKKRLSETNNKVKVFAVVNSSEFTNYINSNKLQYHN